MKRRNCPACGEGEIRDLRKPGRRMPFRSIPDLEVPADCAIPTCTACGEEWLDAGATAKLEAVLKEAFSSTLPKKVDQAIARLVESGVTKQELERLLVLSGGYLSKVTAGKETSGQLAAALMLLAADPEARVQELRDLWRTAPGTGRGRRTSPRT